MPDIDLKFDINKSYKPMDKEQSIREWVYRRKVEMEDAPERKRAERIWEKSERAWDQYRPENREDWQSDYVVPLTTATVEAVMAEASEQVSAPLFLPRGEEDVPRAKAFQVVYDYTKDISNQKAAFTDVIRGQVTHGTSHAQEFYLKDKRIISKIIGFEEKKKKNKARDIKSETIEVDEYDDVYTEWVDNWMLLVDEKCTEINRGTTKARDVIRKYIMNYRDLERMFKKDPYWDHLNNFRYVKPGGNTDYYQYYKPPQGIDHKEEVEVLWYWSRIPDDSLIIVANDVVLRMGPNPYRHKQLPFAKVVDVKRLGKYYGKGEPEILDSIQEESNMMRRMIIDRNHLDIDKMFIVPNDFQGDEDDLMARPHLAIPSNDPNGVRPVEYNDIPLSVQSTLKAINDDKISVTGVDERFQAVSRTPSTATEAAILKESTLRRIKMKMRNFDEGFLIDVARQRASNIIQFYGQPKLEKIIGEKGTKEYKQQVGKLMAQGLLEMDGGEFKKRSYRQITTEGKEMSFNERGQIIERKKPGFYFFEAKPEYFMPVSEQGFNIRIQPSPDIPVSKPLMQDKMRDMFDRLVAVTESTNYDLEKVADKYVEAHEINPDELKSDQAVEEQNIEENRLSMMVDIASQENQMVVSGKDIPPNGTPFASPAHTQIHIAFLQSDVMNKAPEEVFKKLVTHTYGEIYAITQRQGAQGGQQAGAPTPQQGPQGINAANQGALPAQIQGGGDVPTGRALGNG